MFLFGKNQSDPSTRAARQQIADAEMRRALFRLMWDEWQKNKKQPRPCPIFDDERIEAELRRVLGG